MAKFAAYDDMSIYAVADTAEAAITKARDDAREPEAHFETAPVADQFADWIEENGWNAATRSFQVGANGYLRDTTHNS